MKDSSDALRLYFEAYAAYRDALDKLDEATKAAFPAGMPVISNKFRKPIQGTIAGHTHKWSHPGGVIITNNKTQKRHIASPYFTDFEGTQEVIVI